MNKKYKIPIFIVLVLGVAAAAAAYLHSVNIAVLNPKGTIAGQERSLMIIASLLAVLVVLPVFAMTAIISVKYRAGNKKKSKYTPNADHNTLLESIWWGIPLVIILALSAVTWVSTHRLDPYKSLSSTTKPLTIQVVALQWKWLFIYPEQRIATVNSVHLPEDTPINFEITADSPMNSFWIPQLGGQIYAMSGMSTQLHLMASEPGQYRGSSANISGKGFAGMKFMATATTRDDFEEWVRFSRQAATPLNQTTYNQLVKPSENNAAATFAPAEDNLYDTILMKYMGHASSGHDHMQGMNE
jgi:cytochrome o ubiquinol oxidase subunit 2